MKGVAVVLIPFLWAGLTLVALPVIPAEAPAAAARTEPARNPIGVMLGGGGLRIDRRVALARELGAAYFRPWDVDTADWNGQSPDAERRWPTRTPKPTPDGS